MATRCPNCNKFVGLDTELLYDANIDVNVMTGSNDGNAEVVVNVIRALLACGECGTELLEGQAESTGEIEVVHDNCPTPDLNVESSSIVDVRETARPKTHHLDVEVMVKCQSCGAEGTDTIVVDLPFSEFSKL